MRAALLLPMLFACATDELVAPPITVATGALDAWQAAAPLPVARANHCTAVIGDFLLVIGGNRKHGDDFVKTADIHAGRVSADGSIAWHLAGTLPSPATECTATSDGRTLFVLDGLYDNAEHARRVWTASLDDAGMLAPLTSLAPLPQIAISSEATVHAGSLLLVDTLLPDEGGATVTLRTPLAAATWQSDDWGIGFRAQAQYAFTAHHAYALGGYADANAVSADVFVADLASDGTTSPARAATPLPMPIAFGEAVAVDDWLFVAGGRAAVFGAPGTTAVLASPIADDGSLGTWQPVASLPVTRTNHELALVGVHLVLTGGAANGPGDDLVLTARVRFNADADAR